MFHRRLLLLACVTLLVAVGLSAQIARLSVVEGAQRRAEAEAKLDRRVYLPTHRGRILDRHGRILAEDRPSYDIAVSYEVIAGTWAIERAAAQARRELGVALWNAMGPEQRDLAIEPRLPEWNTRTEDLWEAIERLGGLDAEEIARRRNLIRARLQTRSAVVWENQRAAWMRRFGIAEHDEESAFRPRPLVEHRQPHVILPQVGDEVAFEFEKMSHEVNGIVYVLPSHVRIHPWTNAGSEMHLDRGPDSGLPTPLQSSSPITVQVEGVADHIIGSMRSEVTAEEIARRPFTHPRTSDLDLGGYRIGDSIGSRGLEAAFEHLLRGHRGLVSERRNTGEQDRIEPVPGNDLHTTLDLALQSRIQAILSHELGLTRVQSWHNNHPALPVGRPLNSSAVVIEVETGEILGMVSMPTMAMGRRMSETRRDVDDPWVNRPAEGIYPPGSIIKPIVLAAAVMEGVHHLGASIECRGRYYEHIADAVRCWIYRERFGLQTHGHLGAAEALARSCNIFFYTLADRLGMERLSNWFSRFGLGEPLNVGLLTPGGTGESSGRARPSPSDMATLRREGGIDAATVIAGIGQGPMVTWTPLHTANAYATIARGGITRDATLVPDDARAEPRRSREHIAIPPSLVAAILEGLRQSVEEPHGTGYHIRYEDNPGLAPDRIFNAPEVTVWGKTGTAQAPALSVDTTGDGEPDAMLSGLSHAWFVGLVGPRSPRKPTHAIAVLVEYGGSGGRTAGPIANQVIRALQHEGYLPTSEHMITREWNR